MQKENHFKVNCKTKIQGKINLWYLFHLVPQVRVELILEWFLVYLSSAKKVTGLIILKLLTERNFANLKNPKLVHGLILLFTGTNLMIHMRRLAQFGTICTI